MAPTDDTRRRLGRPHPVALAVGLALTALVATSGALTNAPGTPSTHDVGTSVADLWLAAHHRDVETISFALDSTPEHVDAAPDTPRVAWWLDGAPTLDSACGRVQAALHDTAWRPTTCASAWEHGGRPAARRDAGAFTVGATRFRVRLTLVVTESADERRAVLRVDVTPTDG